MKGIKTSLIGLVATTALFVSATASAVKPSERYSIVDLASDINTQVDGAYEGKFDTLLFAAGAFEGVGEYLNGRGQRTLFAPTDQAFENLEQNVLGAFCYDSVLDLPGAYLEDVLLYHVAKGRKDSGSVVPADQIRMLSGDFVTREPGTLFITDAIGRDSDLELVDQFADNGVIHVISEVLVPYAPESNCEI